MLGYEHIRQLWAAPAADFPSATWGSTVAISVPSGPPRFLPPCRIWPRHPQGEALCCGSLCPEQGIPGGCQHPISGSSSTFEGTLAKHWCRHDGLWVAQPG